MTALTRLTPAGIPGRRRRSARAADYDVLLYAEAVRMAAASETSTTFIAASARPAIALEMTAAPLFAAVPTTAFVSEPSTTLLASAPHMAHATEGD